MERSIINKNKFILIIIKLLKMKTDDFMVNLKKNENYETTIYHWAINLYNEGKTLEEAIEIINKRIHLVSSSPNSHISSSYYNDLDVSMIKMYQKVIRKLETNPIYNSLSNNNKEMLQEKVRAFVHTNLYTANSIVNIIINVIKNTLPIKKYKASNNVVDNNSNNKEFNSKRNHFLKINSLFHIGIKHLNVFG